MKNKIGLAITGSALLGSLLVGSTAFAASPGGDWQGGMARGVHAPAPGVFGTVSAISGNTITLNSKSFGPNASTTTYVVDAKSATVIKAGAASTVSAIAVGDMVMAQGTVNGTSITAKTIHNGGIGNGAMGRGGADLKPEQQVQIQNHAQQQGQDQQKKRAQPAPILQGNGQPVIGGNVTAVNGTTLTVTNKSNVTYTVNAASTTVTKAGAASTVANISVGDNVIVQGSVSGSSVTASSIMDRGVAASVNPTPSDARKAPGFFGAVRGFFKDVFGFF